MPLLLNARYEISRPIGSGLRFHAFQATDRENPKRPVVIRTPTEHFRTREFSDLMRLEFPAIRRLRHPALVRLASLEECHSIEGRADAGALAKGALLLVSEPIRGTPLPDALDTLAPSDLAPIVAGLVSLLDELHEAGALHLRLHPSNIYLVQESEVPVLVTEPGFCLPVLGAAERNSPEVLCYAAPERIWPLLGGPGEGGEAGRVDYRADLYSLGAIIHKLATGAEPFPGSVPELLEQKRSGERPGLSASSREGPLQREVLGFALRCLQREPWDRPRSLHPLRGLLGEASAPTPSRPAFVAGPLVGREKETNTLQEALERTCWAEVATAEEPRFLLICGESGSGKTRLGQEVCRRFLRMAPRILQAGFRETAPRPAAALARIIDNLAGEASLAATPLQRLFPFLHGLRSAGSTAAPPALSPRAESFRCLHAAAELIVEASRQAPLVLLLEELQWADETTLEVLRVVRRLLALSLAPGRATPPDEREGALADFPLMSFEDFFLPESPSVSRARLAVWLTYDPGLMAGRPAEKLIEELRSRNEAREVVLEELTPMQLPRLLAPLLGLSHLPTTFVERLSRETGGWPLQLEETARYLLAQGAVTPAPRKAAALSVPVALDEKRAEKFLPAGSLTDLLVRLLRGLPPEGKELARMLSFFEEGASPCMVLDWFDGDSDTMSRLWRLEREGWVNRESDGEGVRFRLRHPRLREAFQKELAPAERQQGHGRAAAVLERVLGSSAGEQVERLAHHFGEAGEARKARAFALRAARRAEAVHSLAQAGAFYEKALETLAANDAREEPLVLVRLGRVLLLRGRLEEAAKRLRKAIELAAKESKEWLAQASRRQLAEALARRGDWSGAEAVLREAGEAAGSQRPLEAARVRLDRAELALRRGFYQECLSLSRDGLSAAEALGHSSLLGAFCEVAGCAALRLVRTTEARPLLQRSLQLREHEDDQAGVASALHNLAALEEQIGALPRAYNLFDRSLQLRRSLGDALGLGISHANLGRVAGRQGNMDRALDHFTQSLRIREATGAVEGLGNTLLNLGGLHLDRGEYADALGCWEKARELFELQKDAQGLAAVLANLSELFLELGSLERAHESAARGLRIAGGAELAREEVAALQALARVAACTQDWEKAERFLEGAGNRLGPLEREDRARLGLMKARLAFRKGDLTRALETCAALSKQEVVQQSAELNAELLLLRGQVERPAEAQSMLRSALTLARDRDNPHLLWRVNAALGKCLHQDGELAAAGRHYREAIDIQRRLWRTAPEFARDSFFHLEERQRLRADALRLKRESELGGIAPTPHELVAGEPPARVAARPRRGETARIRRRLQTAIHQLKEENLNLIKLMELNTKLNSERRLDRLLEELLDSAIELTHAQRGYLALHKVDGDLEFAAARDMTGDSVSEPDRQVSRTILREVLDSGQPILSSNAQEDERYSRSQSVHDLRLTSILCVPLRAEERTIGALYIENWLQAGAFGAKDQRLLGAFADQAALALRNARLYQRLGEKRQQVEESRNRVLALNSRMEDLNRSLEEQVETQSSDLRSARDLVRGRLQELRERYRYTNIVGESPKLKELFRLLDRVASSAEPVLIQGESGTGKEMVARAIHFNGPRRDRVLVAENCAAIAHSLLESELFGFVRGAFTGADRDRKGLFELADGGTLFLDEVGEMNLEMQTKLLRVLETGELRRVGGSETIKVDVRIVAATNQQLDRSVEEGRFRKELYHRLGVLILNLPPLRDRLEDIPLLVEHFLEEFAVELNVPRKRVDKASLRVLSQHHWPGNIRELRNIILGVCSLSDKGTLTAQDFINKLPALDRRRKEPAGGPPSHLQALELGPREYSMEAYVKKFILANQAQMSDTQMAKILGVTRKTIWEKRKKWGLPRSQVKKK